MKFARSKESTKELKEKGVDAPDFDDIDVIPHNEYLKGIEQKDAVLVCVTEPEPLFPDNLQGECSDCGTDIYYRPYNKDATAKVCVSCILKRIGKEKRQKEK